MIIAAGIAALFAACVAVVVCAPVRLRAALRVSEDGHAGDASVRWLWVIDARISTADTAPHVRIFGREWGRKDGDVPASAQIPPTDSRGRPVEPPSPVDGPAGMPRVHERPSPPPVDEGIPHRVPPPPAAPPPDSSEPAYGGADLRGGESGPSDAQESPLPKPRRGLRGRWQRLRDMKRRDLAWRLIRDESVRQGTLHWIRSIFGSLRFLIRFDRLRLHVRASLSDPATTGAAYGYWQGVSHALTLAQSRSLDLRFDPVFDSEYLSGDAEVRLSTSALRLSWPLLITLATFPYVNVGWALWKASGEREVRMEN